MKMRMSIGLITALLLTASVANAQTSQSTTTSAIVDAEVQQLMLSTGFDAVSVTLVRDGQISTHHFGRFADGATPDDQTLYDIGSITKTHTGLILAHAVSTGRLDLDAPIAQYFAEIDPSVFEREGATITIRHLATHTSGLPTDFACDEPEFTPTDRLSCFRNHDQADVLKRLEALEILDRPGEVYRYSNPAIRVLGHILEQVYAEPYETLLEEIVFARTGQIDTHTVLSERQRERWRIGAHENGLPVPDASDYFNPAGGLKSTAPDMGRYIQFYLSQDDPLSSVATRLLIGDRDGLGRAYVWNTFQLDTVGQLYHGGGTFGTSAWMSIYPEAGLGVFMVTPYVTSTAQADLNGASNAIIARLSLQDNE